MSFNHTFVELGSVCEVVRGGSPRPIIDYITEEPDGVNWLKIGDVSETDKYFTHAKEKIKPSGIPKTREVKKGDLILSNSMSFGRAFITKIDGYIHDGWLRLRCDEDKLDKEFLYYFLISSFAQYQFKAIANGSVVNNLKSDTVRAVRIPLLPLPLQAKIASFLGSLDDKIELNNWINENLEQQAQAIYASMFLDNPADGWKRGTLSDIAEITMGQSPSGNSYNEAGNGAVFFQGRAEFGFRFPAVRLYTTEPKRMARKNDVLMSVRAPVGDLNVAHEDCCIGRGLGAIHSKDNHQSFILYTMFSLQKELNVFNGEGTIFGSINRDSLNGMPIVIPPMEKMDEFEAIVAPMDELILSNYDANCRLAQIRDTLLPKLMSGELDVSEVEL